MRFLVVGPRINGEPQKPLKTECVHSVLTKHLLTIQSHLPRAGKWAFPPRALVSSVANSKSQSGPDFQRERLPLSIRAFGKGLPARPGGLGGPRLRAERANAVGAKKRGDHARKRSDLFPRRNSFSRTPLAT